mgnify:CR=1 FL=1
MDMEIIHTKNTEEIRNRDKKRTVLRYIFIVCGILMVLLTVFRLVMGDGLEALAGLPVFILICIFGLRFSGPKSSFITIDTDIEFGDGYMNIIYPSVDRDDGRGGRREIYPYKAKYVEELQYDEKLKLMRIEGLIIIREEYPDGTVRIDNNVVKCKDGSTMQMNYNFVLYLYDDEKRQEILDKTVKSLRHVMYYG